jgi:hypothetical protein
MLKKKYSVENWSEYNQILKTRGSLTIWFSEEVVEKWKSPTKTGKQGRPETYSNQMILTCLMIKNLFKLPYRQTVGFIESIFEKMNMKHIKVPFFTQLQKRAAQMKVPLLRIKSNGPNHLIVDSSGMKIAGEGEWKCRTHGKAKRRKWIKVHIGVDEEDQEVSSAVVSTSNVMDFEVLGEIIDCAGEGVKKVIGDGIFDNFESYKICHEKKIRLLSPPRSNAAIAKDLPLHLLLRNEHIKIIKDIGKKRWKQESNYHKRSLVETAFSRLKRILGEKVYSKKFDTIANEVIVKLNVLNFMTHLGMPETVVVA